MTRSILLTFCLVCLLPSPVLSEETTPETAIGELTGKLDSSEIAQRLEAIAALAARGKDAAPAVPALLKQLDFDNVDVRELAARALGTIGTEADTVVPTLIEHFSDEGVVVKYEPRHTVVPLFAVYAMAVAGFGEEAVDPLIQALSSDTRQVYLGAAVGLEAIGEPAARATPQLIEMLNGTNAPRRTAAAGAIRGIGPGAAEAIPALVTLLHDENFHTQYWGCRALGAIGPASAVATGDLLELLADGTASVRRNAAMALGNIGPDVGPEAAAKLIRVVDEEFIAPVRQEAVIALGKLKPFAKDSVPALQKALANPNFPLPTHAARSLWLLTDDPNDALPTLIKSLDDLTYFQLAAEVLGEMGPEAAPAIDRLIQALEERDPDDRAAAALTLARIGPAAAKANEPLRKLLEDQEAHVREAAQTALETLASSDTP